MSSKSQSSWRGRMRKARRYILAPVALILIALASVTSMSKTGFVNLPGGREQAPSKLVSANLGIPGHRNKVREHVREHGKPQQAASAESVSDMLPAKRAHILQKQALRPLNRSCFSPGVCGLRL